MDRLVLLLSGPSPHVLLVIGAPGSGKSSLLRALVARMKIPLTFVAYRPPAPPSSRSGGNGDNSDSVALLLIDPRKVIDGEAKPGDYLAGVAMSFAPLGASPSESAYPPALQESIVRMVNAGGGCIVCDSWDRSSEEDFRMQGAGGSPPVQFLGSIRALRDQLTHTPVHMAISVPGDSAPDIESAADGVIHLGWEPFDPGEIRCLRVMKMRSGGPSGMRYLYSLDGGAFSCPSPAETKGGSAVRPPEADPGKTSGGLWPGSSAYARAFGRLRANELTGVEMDDEIPNSFVDLLSIPLVTSTLRAGGRVAWVPSTSMPLERTCRAIDKLLPEGTLQRSLRILTAAGAGAPMSYLESVVIPIRPAAHSDREARSTAVASVEPSFPTAFQFLRDRPADSGGLLLGSLDGLRAVSSLSGNVYDAATLPLVLAQYVQLTGVSGMIIGRREEPFTPAVIPGSDVHLRVRNRHGQTVVAGVRPLTPAYLLDWKVSESPYTLVMLS
jgi:hypothetical protein